jgi:antitoxin YefM
MKTIPFNEAQANLDQVMDSVCSDRKPIAITQPDGRNAVLVSMEEFEAFEEAAYLLQSPKNALRLLEAVQELETLGDAERTQPE